MGISLSPASAHDCFFLSSLRSPRSLAPPSFPNPLFLTLPPFTRRPLPTTAAPFFSAVEAAIKVVQVIYPNRPLRARVISFIHRMVECLATAILPHLPPLLIVLLGPTAECPDVCESLQLLTQLAGRFKEDLGPLLTEAFPTIVSRYVLSCFVVCLLVLRWIR